MYYVLNYGIFFYPITTNICNYKLQIYIITCICSFYSLKCNYKEYIKGGKTMAKVQAKAKDGSFVIALPPYVAKYLEVGKGDTVEYEFNQKTKRVELVKSKAVKK